MKTITSRVTTHCSLMDFDALNALIYTDLHCASFLRIEHEILALLYQFLDRNKISV